MNRNNRRIKAIICSVLVAGMLAGCTSNNAASKNKNNKGTTSEAVVEYKQGSASKKEVFDQMAKISGLNITLSMADKGILEEIYPSDQSVKEKVDSQLEDVKAKYGEQFEEVLMKNGFSDEARYVEVVTLNLLREKYILKYIEDNMLSEDEIKAFYENYSAKVKASHILIKNEDNSEEAMAKAKKTAEEIVVRLDNGEDFAALAKEFSADPGSAANGGDLGFFGRGQMVPSFEESAYSLKVNEYTKEPVQSQFGYHIILKTDEEKKESFEDMRATIVETLALQMVKQDATIGDKALIKMRDENGLKFLDDTLKGLYEEFVNGVNGEKTEETDK